MSIDRIRQEFRIALGFFPYIRNPLTLDQARREITDRLYNRDSRFLELAHKLIYSNPRNPFRALLLWAGCQYPDLEKSVHTLGLERTLEKLRDSGVYLTLEEFKSQVPISRPGLNLETGESDYDNPFLQGKSIPAASSGSRAKSTRVLYDWNFFAEEASNEMLLYETHGLSRTPFAFWMPSLPSISGIHNLLIHARFRYLPDKWFSHLQPDKTSRTKMKLLAAGGNLFGLKLPQPEFCDMSNAERIAIWMEKQLKENRACMVKTFASSAIRIAQAALEKGIDISGSIMFTGGEPLTDRRYRFLQSIGVQAFARFVTTEVGLVAAGCPHRNRADSMHLYTDRLAVIQRERKVKGDESSLLSLLFTTLSECSGKILLNTELGDSATVEAGSCDCLFGKLGMNLQISEVRSFDKLTGEGMTLLGSTLDEVVGELVQKAGGGPDDYQFWENQGENGLTTLTITISPKVILSDETTFANEILNRLQSKDVGSSIASHFWKQANTLRIVRESPQISRGFKMLPLIKQPRV